MQFAKNMGSVDRALRAALGLLLIALALTGTVGLWGYVGIIPLATAFISFCPLYPLIGLKTCKEC